MNGYERWSPKPAPKTYQLNYIGVASGYLFGHTSTITMQLYAATLEDAKRMFDIALEDSHLVNLSDYHVTRKD